METRRAVEELLVEIVAELTTAGLSPTLTTDPSRAEGIIDSLADVANARGQRRVEWIAINDRRVDATITVPGREWRVACSIDGDGVHSASSFERPALFTGVPGGRAVLVSGPSSSGKSTVMRAVLDAATDPWIMFDELSFGTVDWPYLIWPDQVPTLQEGFLAGITALAAAGNQVILTGEGVNGPPAGLAQLVATVPTLTVALECPLEVRIARQRERIDRWGGLTEGAAEDRHSTAADLRFDTSKLAAGEIAEEILSRVKDHPGGSPRRGTR